MHLSLHGGGLCKRASGRCRVVTLGIDWTPQTLICAMRLPALDLLLAVPLHGPSSCPNLGGSGWTCLLTHTLLLSVAPPLPGTLLFPQ
jgi:hypothetical protein